MRVKMRLKNLDELNGVIEKRVSKTLKNKKVSEGVSNIVAKGVKDRNIKVKSPVTLAWRKYLEKGNTTDGKYARTKINFTFTGELLKDLARNVKLKITKKGAEYTIQNSKSLHKKYKNPEGKPLKGKPVSFKQINTYLNSLGYYYLKKVSKKRTDQIVRYLKKEIMNRFK